MAKLPDPALADHRSAYAGRSNGRSAAELKRNKLLHKELARMPWAYGPQCTVPVPRFSDGAAALLSAALHGQRGGDLPS